MSFPSGRITRSILCGAAISFFLVAFSLASQAFASHSGWFHETTEFHTGAHDVTHHMSGETRVSGTTTPSPRFRAEPEYSTSLAVLRESSLP